MRATHKGTCQVCHREQLLPGGRLAKHGYSVDYGCFNGVCFGAGHLPLEQSCELVKKDIERHQTARATMVTLQATLEASQEPRGYVSIYVGRRYARVWLYLPLVYYADQKIYALEGEKRHPIEGYQIEFTKDPAEAARILNRTYIDERLVPDRRRMDEHIARQERTVLNWKPLPLIPRVEEE